jgi:hypothetical protein
VKLGPVCLGDVISPSSQSCSAAKARQAVFARDIRRSYGRRARPRANSTFGDANISEDEWECRRGLIDVHDRINRSAFLSKIGAADDFPEDALRTMRERLENNAFFQTLPAKRQQRLLDGEDMFVNGRHAAMLELGWGDDFSRGLYKYLSNRAHSLSVSFHRTADNELYKNDSAGAQVVAAFGLSFARLALGASSLHMIELFPDIELGFDQIILSALKTGYKRN